MAMNDQDFPLRVPVIKVIQPLGEFFACSLPAETLLQVSYSDPLRLLGFSEEGGYELKGNQRKLVEARLRAIGRFADTVEAAFPNAIILAANYRESGELADTENVRWRVEIDEDTANSTLVIPTAEKLAAIVDGQHRLYGFRHAEKPDRISMPLLCSVYLDLPQPYQAYLFATINYNQKPVDKSQSYELYAAFLEDEAPETWSPEKTAVFLCRKLNTDGESPFHEHIIVAAQSDEAIREAAQAQKKAWGISTAAIVEGLLRLFASNPKRDRDEMHKAPVDDGRHRTLLSKPEIRDSTPLREYYLRGNDLLIYTLTKNYFRALASLVWDDNPKSFIRKTIGIQASFDILRRLATEASENKNVSEAFFKARLLPCKEINFSDEYFHASGTGRTRVRNAMELRLGVKKIEDMPEGERNAYRRACAFA